MHVEPLVIAMLAVVALLAGTVDAIAGGGGLITLPALIMAGVTGDFTFGTNKGQSVWGSGAAMVAFFRAGKIDVKRAPIWFVLAATGSYIGAQLVLLIPKDVLRPVVIAMLVGAAILLLLKKPTREEDGPPAHPLIAAVLAFVIGAYDGFFGPGTGTFLIVGFVALCGMSTVRATANAKVVNFASNVAALTAFALHASVLWRVALPMAGGQLVGGVIGARLAVKGGAKLVRIMVVLVSAALVVKLGIDLVRSW